MTLSWTAETELITKSLWDRIRDRFDEDEKKQLFNAICGETICPPGAFVLVSMLSAEVVQKIKEAKHGEAQSTTPHR